MGSGMRAVLFAVGALLLTVTSASAAQCPENTIKVACDNGEALAHVYNEHCSGKAGKSEFERYYCKNLMAACQYASEHPAKVMELNCFAKGEEGEIVGYTPDKKPTNCFQATFVQSGFGAVTLKTMYPVKDSFCR
jgi:hypothetical protein